MGRGPSYALQFLTPAYEFLSRASCNKPQGLAERCKIFISGPNKVFIGFLEHSSLRPRLRTLLFISPSQFGSLPVSLCCSQLCGKCEDADISSEVDIGESHGCFTFSAFLWKPAGRMNTRTDGIFTRISCPPVSVPVTQLWDEARDGDVFFSCYLEKTILN